MAIAVMTLDPDAAPPENAARLVRNETGVGLTEGQLVYLSSWNEAQVRHLVALADADLAGAQAVLIMRAALANLTNGSAYRTHRLTGVNTVGSSVGAPVYLSATAGGWTLTAPTAAGAIKQVVGRVAVVGATGVIEFDLANLNLEAIGSNEHQDGSIAAAKIAAGAIKTKLTGEVDGSKLTTGELAVAAGIVAGQVAAGAIKTKLAAEIDGNKLTTSELAAAAALAAGQIAAGAIKTKLGGEVDGNKLTTSELAAAAGVTNAQIAVGQAKANLDAMADTARGYIKTSPTTGQFKVVSIERKADGKAQVSYDDVAV